MERYCSQISGLPNHLQTRSLFTETKYITKFLFSADSERDTSRQSRGKNTVLSFTPNAFKMHQTKPLFTKAVMGVLTSILISAYALGNGFVVAIIARFKSFQTVPNIFIGNLVLVDLLNSTINLPIQFINLVLEHAMTLIKLVKLASHTL